MESSKNKPKNRGKHWLFQCFNNPNDVVPLRRKKKNKDPLLSYIAVAEKHGIVLPAILPPSFTMGRGGGEGSATYRKKIGKDSYLHRTLVATLNKTPLANKLINMKKINKGDMPKSNTITHIEEGDEISNAQQETNLSNTLSSSSASHCSPVFTPSSSLSSSTNSRSSQGTQESVSSSCELSFPMKGIAVMKQKQDVGESRKGYLVGSNKFMYVLSTSLVVLVLWGKFCAIVFTSIGLFLVSRCWRRPYIKMEIIME